jgi:hypothetical protein
MPPRRYRITHSQHVRDQFRSIIAQATQEGRLGRVVRAARRIFNRLRSRPLAFGESRTRHAHAKLLQRAGFSGPLFVEYAVHAEQPIVWIKRFYLLPRG